jgi:hypothetical protein
VREAGTERIRDRERFRLSLDVTPKMKAIIDELAADSDSTQADVLRRAVALLKVVTDAKNQGETPALVDGEGRVTTKIIGV